MKRIVTFLLVMAIAPRILNAQQDPIYAQYLNNPLTFNPAYAGSNNMFNATLQYRTQWAGLDANPTTVNFTTHMSVYRNKMGLGLMVVEDKLGDIKNTEVNAVYSYKIQVEKTSIAFGIQTGFIRYSADPSGLTIRDAGDAAFNQWSETKFNTGAGVIVKNDRFMLGFSVPRLLPATVSQGGQNIELYKQHYYALGSYVMFISPAIRFKPSVLLRGTSGAPLSADVNASFNIHELYTAGIFTRNFATYGVILQALVKSVRFGYVFELPGSPASSLNFTSHEFMIGLSMSILSGHDKSVKTF